MRSKIIFALIASLFSFQAFAGGGVDAGGATELTQMANNSELIASVAKQSQMVANQVNDYQQQILQYETMVQNLKNLPTGQIQSRLAAYQAALNSAKNVYTAVSSLQSSATTANQVYSSRINEMAKLNLSPSEYLTNEVTLARAKGGIYQQKIDSDRQALQDVQAKAQALDAMQPDIDAISGNVQGLQNLAKQNHIMTGELIQLNSNLTQQHLDMLLEKQQKEGNNPADTAEQARLDAKSAIDSKDRMLKSMTSGSVHFGF